MIKLPGLIDAHVHLRDPGQTHKEDFTSGTRAALAGGFTTVIDMPNNAEPIISIEALKKKMDIARKKAVSNIGFHYGSLGENLDTFEEAAEYALGLKLYLNNTTGGYMLDPANLRKIYAAWPDKRPVLLHAEEDFIDVAIESLKEAKRHIHICHMPSKEILEKIIKAKQAGFPVTCGVCPHHLFHNSDTATELAWKADMLPSIKTRADQDYLWEHLDDIDIFESDHAPHTRKEKEAGAHGVPGLETTLPLLLQAERANKITREQIIDKCHTTPAKLFNVETSEDTYIEVDEIEYQFDATQTQTKADWSPFEGMKVFGRVQKVVVNGEARLENGEITALPGDGSILS